MPVHPRLHPWCYTTHTHIHRQCQFPRQDPCLSSPDWITLVQHGAVTLGLRVLHGPAGPHVGPDYLGLQWKKALRLGCVIFWWLLLLLLHKLEWPHVLFCFLISLSLCRHSRTDKDNKDRVVEEKQWRRDEQTLKRNFWGEKQRTFQRGLIK